MVLSRTYDDLGNILTVDDSIDGLASAGTTYQYDALNRMILTSQSGSKVSEKRVVVPAVIARHYSIIAS